jgi:H+/Cl- antiporter ClcA
MVQDGLKYLVKWLFICLIIAVPIGAASSFFLHTLNGVTDFREGHLWIIWFLPVCGFFIAFSYDKYGKEFSSGNNLILDTIHKPDLGKIPLLKAFMIYITTIATHLFGGSAGREGTALQMAGSIADQFTKILKVEGEDRRILIIASVAAGFGSVFGTPAAGTLFAVEYLRRGKISYRYIIPAALAGYFADFTGHLLWSPHTSYAITSEIFYTSENITFVILTGIAFGLVARFFTNSIHFISSVSKNLISYAPIRAFTGGLIILSLFALLQDPRFLGLGVPVIKGAFTHPVPGTDFMWKFIFTVITIGFGFKGGEVTPLFFIGATLGNALHPFTSLPLDLLAGLGFVSVFSAATNTPVASTLMAMELFGWECGLFTAITCIISYLVSGRGSIYVSQL